MKKKWRSRIFLALFVFFVLFVGLSGCGATYPDNDTFKEHIPAFKNHYYFTNFTYRFNGNALPSIEVNSEENTLFFFINQRDDIYLQKGFDVDLKKYDTRWFLQISNFSQTNYFLFSNEAFSSDVSFHYYELGGSPVRFTNGYLFITQASPLNWYVETEVEKDGTRYSSSGNHRLADYNKAEDTVTLIE